MPRFVVLRHDSPQGLHWDFMLERGDMLRTWALEQEPTPQQPIAAHALADHRPAYLDYEGPVSGDRGSVTQFDCGTYEAVDLRDDKIVVNLAGGKLKGRAVLERAGGSSGTQENCWEFRFEP